MTRSSSREDIELNGSAAIKKQATGGQIINGPPKRDQLGKDKSIENSK
jgi:hypothetical protein